MDAKVSGKRKGNSCYQETEKLSERKDCLKYVRDVHESERKLEAAAKSCSQYIWVTKRLKRKHRKYEFQLVWSGIHVYA
jgi:hypothetical protein